MRTRLHHELLRRLRDAGRIDWNRACVDFASIAAKKGALRRGLIQQIDPETGEVLEAIEMPAGVNISGLEAGGDQFSVVGDALARCARYGGRNAR